MTVEELLMALHAPLPGPPQLSDDQVARLKAWWARMTSAPPRMPELPTAPQWMLDYSRSRGLLPEQRMAYLAPPAPVIQQPEQPGSQGGGLWGWLHPQGVGTTARGFNDIYPPVGR